MARREAAVAVAVAANAPEPQEEQLARTASQLARERAAGQQERGQQLVEAAKRGDRDGVAVALAAGADVNGDGGSSLSPLLWACR